MTASASDVPTAPAKAARRPPEAQTAQETRRRRRSKADVAEAAAEDGGGDGHAAEPRSGLVVYRDDPGRVPWVAFVEKGSRAARQAARTAALLNDAAGPDAAALERGRHVQPEFFQHRSLALLGRIVATRARLDSALGPDVAAALSSLPRGKTWTAAMELVRPLGPERVSAALRLVQRASGDLPGGQGFVQRARALRRALDRKEAELASDFRFGCFLRTFIRSLDSLAARLSNKRFDADSPPFVGYISGPLVMLPVSGFDPATLPSYAEREGDEEEGEGVWDVEDGASPPPLQWLPSHSIEDVTWSLAETFWHGDTERLAMILERLGLLGQERPSALQAVGDKHGLTRERVRQLEAAFVKGLPTGPNLHVPALSDAMALLADEAPLLASRAGPRLFRAGLAASPSYHALSLLRLAALLAAPVTPLEASGLPAAGLPEVLDEPGRLPRTLALLSIAVRQARACGLATAASVAAEAGLRGEGAGVDEAAAGRALRAFVREEEDEEGGDGGAGDPPYLASRNGGSLWFLGPVPVAASANDADKLAVHRCALKLLAAAAASGRGRVPLRAVEQAVERTTRRIAGGRAASRQGTGGRVAMWRAAREHGLLEAAELAAALAAHPSFRLEVWRDLPDAGPEPAPAALLEWLREGPGRPAGGDGGALASGDVFVALREGVQAPDPEEVFLPSELAMLRAVNEVLEAAEAVGEPGGPLHPSSLVAALVAHGPMSATSARMVMHFSPLLYRIFTASSRAPGAEKKIARKCYFAAWGVPRPLLSVDMLLDVPW